MRIYVAISSVLETACFHRQYACKCWLASPPGVSHAPVRARTRLNGNLVQLVMVDGEGASDRITRHLATRDDLFQKPVLGANVPCGRRTVD